MRSGRHSCVVPAVAPEALWDYLSDYASLLSLSSSSAHATLLEGSVGVEGCKYRAYVGWEGLKTEFTVCLVRADRPHSLQWTSRSHGGVCSALIELDPVDAGTRVNVTVEYSASQANFPLEPFAWGLLKPMFDRAMRTMGKLELTR